MQIKTTEAEEVSVPYVLVKTTEAEEVGVPYVLLRSIRPQRCRALPEARLTPEGH